MSSLLLDRHFFTRVELKSNPDGKPDATPRAVCQLQMAKDRDDPRRYQVTLTVTVDPGEGPQAKPYYTGAIEVVGFFRVREGYKDDADKLAHISGASLLYGSVRELFCNLSARGPWPMVTLPTMNFTPQPQSKEVEVPQKTPELKATPKRALSKG